MDAKCRGEAASGAFRECRHENEVSRKLDEKSVMERSFERYFMESTTKHDLKHANSFTDEWEPQRAKIIGLDCWKMNKEDLQKC